jgi:hypothetical protein
MLSVVIYTVSTGNVYIHHATYWCRSYIVVFVGASYVFASLFRKPIYGTASQSSTYHWFGDPLTTDLAITGEPTHDCCKCNSHTITTTTVSNNNFSFLQRLIHGKHVLLFSRVFFGYLAFLHQ